MGGVGQRLISKVLVFSRGLERNRAWKSPMRQSEMAAPLLRCPAALDLGPRHCAGDAGTLAYINEAPGDQ